MSVPRMPVQFQKAPKHHALCQAYGKGSARGCAHCEQLNKRKPSAANVSDDLK